MILIDCQIPMEKIEFIENELGLPNNFKSFLIRKFPEFFWLEMLIGRSIFAWRVGILELRSLLERKDWILEALEAVECDF